jgi:hypothetical protein
VVRFGSAREQAHAAIEQLGASRASSGPDVLVVAMQGSVQALDDATRELLTAARETRSVTAVVTATGHRVVASSTGLLVARLLRAVVRRPVVSAAGDGGLFLRPGISSQEVASALPKLRAAGRALFTDAFPTYSLPLAGFC